MEQGREKIVVAIDHGFSMMKTQNYVFPNGVKAVDGEAALIENTLKYNGYVYKVGEGRLPMKKSKVEDEDYFLLTLAAIAREMKYRGLQCADVTIAAGLPFSRFGQEKKAFKEYLKREGNLFFFYSGKAYEIAIEEVYLFPQCYAAIAKRLISEGPEQLAIDIGSKTVDIIHTHNYVPIESESTSIPHALIQCMEGIKNDVYSTCNRQITDSHITQIILGDEVTVPKDCEEVICKGLERFARTIEAKIEELGFDMDLMPVTFLGGGALVMKWFGRHKGDNICYMNDIRSNALGYEFLVKNKGQ